MAKKKQHHDEHLDETWLIPYADMLTLLLALFIVMFAMSKVDSQKLAKMSEEFSVIFSGGTNVLQSPSQISPPLQELNIPKSESMQEDDKMHEIKQLLEEEIDKEGYSGKILVVLDKEGLSVSIQDIVLFKSGDAKIVDDVSPILTKISGMLNNLDNKIKIVGHTDNEPIRNAKFRSNWDLSAMRAINVMNFMVEKGGLPADKFSIQAYGEYKPKYDNATEEGRAQNRRVEIFIDRKYPLDSKMAGPRK